MGKFGIGARVRDSGGDEGVVTAKKKGERLVKYDFELFGSIWNTKGNLTALADNDNISPETSESAYSGEMVARGKFVNTPSGDTAVVDGDVDDKGHVWIRYTTGQRSRLLASWLTAWVPKVGERVRNKSNHSRGEGSIISIVSEGAHVRYDRWSNGHDGRTGDGSKNCWWDDFDNLEPLPTAEQPAAPADAGGGFKAGDRIRLISGELTDMPLGSEFVAVKRTSGATTSVHFTNKNGHLSWRPGSYFELVAPLTIKAGGFYKTRDGRKVGPGRDHDFNIGKDRYGRKAAFYFDGLGDVDANGVWLSGDGNEDHDLIAEWVEPVDLKAEVETGRMSVNQAREHIGLDPLPVAVAEATATLNLEVGGKYLTRGGEQVEILKLSGDKDWPFVSSTNGYHAVSADGKSCLSQIQHDIVSAIPATPAKFKVGDRVGIFADDDNPGTVTGYVGDEVGVRWDEHHSFYRDTYGEDELTLIATIPVGSTVTFTATGRLSAVNDNGHMQVTFPGLAPGQNSFALPAKFVTAA